MATADEEPDQGSTPFEPLAGLMHLLDGSAIRCSFDASDLAAYLGRDSSRHLSASGAVLGEALIDRHALRPVEPGEGERFIKAFGQAKQVISSMKGVGRLTLSRCVERPNSYLLVVTGTRSRTTPRASGSLSSIRSGGGYFIKSTSRFRPSSTSGPSMRPSDETHRRRRPDGGRRIGHWDG